MPVAEPNGSLLEDAPVYEDLANVSMSTTPGVTAAAIALVDPRSALDDVVPGTAGTDRLGTPMVAVERPRADPHSMPATVATTRDPTSSATIAARDRLF
jgi:hypothetical protein